MDIAALLAFNLAILGALASPGPAVIAMLRASLGSGRRAGFLCGLGLSVGATLWSLLAVLGLSALFAVAPWAFLALKIAGGAYLIWLALSLWRNADAPAQAEAPQGLNGFRLGLVTNMANPKAVVFIAAIFTTVFPAMPTGASAALVLANHLALEIMFYSALTFGLTIPAFRAAYMRFKAVFDRAAAAVLGVMALRIAT
ncbi:Threonine/homoserine/homoserine lactone efflux protein [Thalassovita litoralis]|uniref:Threonine/homoserine/homoserine lactone efflux protein n=1 Tax=Thalassovita litoralis TaxID=1010611 RepID=A0A521ETL9_9RHOB|nr:LysE family transporter [Thalassovita litoralis]SMO87255.1 Threonine/homoserine/homoserine lactone efflux protein [Thalassovita litoralis]